MRLYLPSIAIASLFAGNSHGFAPPSSSLSSAHTSTSRLHNNLSEMLSDYSGSAPKTAATAVEKVADAVVSSPVVVTPPPPPPVVNPTEVANSAIDSITKAADSSQNAADQAAAAAAAVTSKMAAVTKGVSAVGGGLAAGGVKLSIPIAATPGIPAIPSSAPKFPVQIDPSKLDPTYSYDGAARREEYMNILKANWNEMIGQGSGQTGSSYDTPHLNLPLDNLPSSEETLAAVAAIIAALNIEEYGAWYVAAFMALFAFQQRGAGKAEASAEFESELADAQAKALEAASAAGLAAEGANKAKKLAMQMEKDLKKDGGEAMLESSRSKMAAMDKDIMEKEMLALKAEVASLKSQLEATKPKKKAAPTKRVKTEIEEEYPTKVTMESDPEENARVIELLKLMDEENAINNKEAAKLREKKREEEAKFVAAEKAKAESKKMTKGVEAAQAKAEVAKKKASAKKSTVKKATKKAATKRTVAKTVEKQSSGGGTAVATTTDDWATLAESTLKRKTVAQLTEYLTGKGVSGISRKKKAELLDIVKSL